MVILTVIQILIKSINYSQGNLRSSKETFSLFSSLLSYEYKMILKRFGNIDGTKVIEGFSSITTPIKKDMELWVDLCENGDIYTYMKNEIKEKRNINLTRNQVKDLFFTFMYSSVYTKVENKDIFKDTFNSIDIFFNKIKTIIKKKKGHSVLSILLQLIESFIWVENILPILDKERIKYLFIHDAVIVQKENKSRVEDIIEKVYRQFEVNVQYKTELLKK